MNTLAARNSPQKTPDVHIRMVRCPHEDGPARSPLPPVGIPVCGPSQGGSRDLVVEKAGWPRPRTGESIALPGRLGFGTSSRDRFTKRYRGEGMRAAKLGIVLLLTVGSVSSSSEARAAGRVALVVGNSTYDHIGRLPNPENDAVDLAAALQRLGFEVTTEVDADRVELTEALRAFTRRSAGADVSVVFYAGHGIEMDGVNYVVPVDARLERDVDVRFETVTLDDLLVSTAGASLRLVILDACRNNPLARSMQRTAATRMVSGGSFGDLNEDLLGDETLVAYAAAAGTTAADGRGRNSPYTSALLTHLEQPLELSALFRRVRAAVLEATDGEQRPHEYASLVREHYLSGAPGSAAPVAASGATVDGATAAARLQQETVFWESIRESTTASDFEAYLRQFPAGVYRGLATTRLAALRASAAADPAAAPSEAPDPTEVETFRDCRSCPEMVVIPAGTFRMGCVSGSDDCDDDEFPVHEVMVSSFGLSKYEVTRGQFRAFVAATGHNTGGGCGGGSWRVVCVRRDDAQAYARWLSRETGERYRLPSESEWEYAARAGTTTPWYWGDRAENRCEYANGWDSDDDGCDDGWRWTAPVGSFRANGFGLHDMAGNVWEWVEDCWHNDYDGAPRDGSARTRGGDCGWRVLLRGGGWNRSPGFLRSAYRNWKGDQFRFSNRGFRVARTPD